MSSHGMETRFKLPQVPMLKQFHAVFIVTEQSNKSANFKHALVETWQKDYSRVERPQLEASHAV